MRRRIGAFFLAMLFGLTIRQAGAELICDISLYRLDSREQPSTWSLWMGENCLQLSGSLHPKSDLLFKTDGALLPHTLEKLLPFLMRHPVNPDTVSAILLDWFGGMNAREEGGLYSGDTFEKASLRTVMTAAAPALLWLKEKSASFPDGLFENVVDLFCAEFLKDQGLQLLCSCYDEGKTFSFQLSRKSEILGTLSLNCSEPGLTESVITVSEQGRLYHIGYQVQQEAEDRFYTDVILCADPEEAGYAQSASTHMILSVHQAFTRPAESSGLLVQRLSGRLCDGRNETILRWEASIQRSAKMIRGAAQFMNPDQIRLYALDLTVRETDASAPDSDHLLEINGNTGENILRAIGEQYSQFFSAFLSSFRTE